MTGERDTNTWIIDTRNLNHMHELRDIQSRPIGLPNGEHTTTIKEGSVVLDGYVPKLNCNLIFVSQMVDELKCVVQFTDKLCVV